MRSFLKNSHLETRLFYRRNLARSHMHKEERITENDVLSDECSSEWEAAALLCVAAAVLKCVAPAAY